MSQGATVFLIDLGRGASGMQKALLAMGFQAGAGSQAQLAEVLGQAVPQVMVAPVESYEGISSSLAQVEGTQNVLIFLLSKDADAPMSRVPKGVSAVVPDDIDPGVLGLRIKAAAQTSIFPRQHQATLLGLPAGAVPRAPAVPQMHAPAPAASPRAPSVPPPLPVPAQEEASAQSSSVPLVQAQMSSSKIAIAPQRDSASSEVPASTIAPDSEQAVASASPVAISIPSTDLAQSGAGSAGSRRKPLLLAAAAVTLLAGGGAAFFLGTGQESSAVAASPSEQASEAVVKNTVQAPAVAQSPKAAAAPTAEEKSAAAPSKVAEEKEADDSAADAKQESPEPAVVEAEAIEKAEPGVGADSGALASLFTISETNKMESCEEMLGKTEADFAQTVKWKSAHNWKLARKNLMAGKTQEAAKKMCESAFIDPTGPAVAGLVNYYLSERALDQAYTWAQKGVEASPKSRAAKEALGDVLNQMGRIGEAKKVWLSSFGLEDESDARLAGVVRNYVRSAGAARRGGAVPLAERLLRRALSFDEKNKGAAMQLAGVLRKNSQPELAKRWDEYAASL